MATQARLAKEAIYAKDYQTAVDHLTTALKESQSPSWLIQRSTAYQRLGKHELALADADNAVLAARSRARRELIAEAQFRRAVALHGLKRFGDARLCLVWTRKLDEKFKALAIWQAKVSADYESAGGDGAPGNETTVKEYPDKAEQDIVSSVPANQSEENTTTKDDKGKTPERPVAAAPILSATPKEKIRHEFYQSNEKLTITVFAKGVPKDQGEIKIKERSLDINFPVLGSDSTYHLSFDPLFARVDPDKSSYRITPHKIEIILQKAVVGPKWPYLEGTEAIPSITDASEAPAIASHSVEKAPAYPTSSRHGPKDWDAVATTALKVKKATEGGDEEEVEDEGTGGDPTNRFFQQLYKNADPDTKRAMIKSYQESNGTALSTNWAEVKKETVKTQPPEGVVAKKWGE